MSKPQRMNQPSGIRRHLGALIDELDALGIETPVDVRTKHTHALVRDRAAKAATTTLDAELDRVVTELAEDRVTEDEALDQFVAAHRRADRHTGNLVLVRAAERAAVLAWAQLIADAQPLFASLVADFNITLDSVVKAGSQLPAGITDDETATRAAPKVRETWASLVSLVDRIDRLHRIAHRLRSHAVIPSALGGQVPESIYRFRKPELTLEGEPPARRISAGTPTTAPDRAHPVARLLAQIARGADPAMLSAADVEESLNPSQRRSDTAA